MSDYFEQAPTATAFDIWKKDSKTAFKRFLAVVDTLPSWL
jgi:hypothetical protein